MLGNGDLYQRLVDDQHAACRLGYEGNTEYMAQAWDAAVDQLTQLFAQWAGEELPLTFVHVSGIEPEALEPPA